MVIVWCGGSLFLLLIAGMIICLILGMGIPTTAAYVLCAAVVAPALTTVGAQPLSVHLFIFYFAIIAAITPPVCGAVYVASAIAGSNWWKTGWIATRLGLSGFVVPFMFFYAPTLLLYGDVKYIIINSLTAALGIVALSAAVMGFLRKPISWIERLLLFLSAGLLILPGIAADISGILILALIYGNQRLNLAPFLMKRPLQTK
jgi:TRAP-type uncharacterized transport system fused permease subunit